MSCELVSLLTPCRKPCCLVIASTARSCELVAFSTPTGSYAVQTVPAVLSNSCSEFCCLKAPSSIIWDVLCGFFNFPLEVMSCTISLGSKIHPSVLLRQVPAQGYAVQHALSFIQSNVRGYADPKIFSRTW